MAARGATLRCRVVHSPKSRDKSPRASVRGGRGVLAKNKHARQSEPLSAMLVEGESGEAPLKPNGK